MSALLRATAIVTAPLHAARTSIPRSGGPGNGSAGQSPASPWRPKARQGIEQSPPVPATTPAIAAHPVRPIVSLFRSPVRLRSCQQADTTGQALANLELGRGLRPRRPERSGWPPFSSLDPAQNHVGSDSISGRRRSNPPPPLAKAPGLGQNREKNRQHSPLTPPSPSGLIRP